MKIRLFIILAILGSCPADLLNDDEYLDRMLRSAIRKANLTLLSTYIKKFQPQGVTGIAVLGESHIAVHSWPENGQLFIDIATCSTQESASMAFAEILAHFPDGRVASYQELEVAGGSSS
ncbi:MAG: adenosylmethionine decarboxylase [Acidobacteria bacterium]|nr:adenosylmethionine decarboxylase [Acidobacteriota bacterium]